MEAVPSKAPVRAHVETEITASPQEVWDVLADIEGWPTWNPAIRDASLDGDFDVGTYFRWAAGPGTITSRLTVVDAPVRMVWTGSFLTLRHTQAWVLRVRPQGTFVAADEAITGLAARLLSARLTRSLQGDLDTWLGLLKLEAEARRATPDESSPARSGPWPFPRRGPEAGPPPAPTPGTEAS